MAKIVKSLTMVVAIAVVAGYSTYSYFSDTETSQGNNFTSGKLYLVVNVDGRAFTDNIFTLDDMKPGDPGEKTVKIKVEDNPACATVKVDLKDDLDNTCNEPEREDDAACDPAGTRNGELNDAVNFGIWADTNCNNIYESGEQFLTQGTLTEDLEYHIGELTTAERCYGVQWCFGTMTVDESAHTIACDGSNLNDASQTDSFSADLVVSATQKRNQFPDGCPVDGSGNEGGEPVCVPSAETCDGEDNDCDEEVDEGCVPWINEIHYDNTGTDTDEGIEIAGRAGVDLLGWKVIPYNGSDYRSYTPVLNLSGIIPNQQTSFGTLWFNLVGLQNGTPDGIALVAPDNTVVQFLSYEGSFTATNGPAVGRSSVDIGISESGSEAVNQSLQLLGTGNEYSDFSWNGPTGHSRGAVNTGQTFN